MDKLHIYTESACSGNPGPGGSAAVLWADATLIKKVSQGYRHTTKHRMELTAAILGLKAAMDSSISKYDYIIVHSDSEMVMGVMNKGCKPKDDTDLVEELKSLAARTSATGVPVYFEMANGRDDWDYFNEVADELAEAACSASDAMEDKGYVRKEASQATWPDGEAN